MKSSLPVHVYDKCEQRTHTGKPRVMRHLPPAAGRRSSERSREASRPIVSLPSWSAASCSTSCRSGPTSTFAAASPAPHRSARSTTPEPKTNTKQTNKLKIENTASARAPGPAPLSPSPKAHYNGNPSTFHTFALSRLLATCCIQ